MQGLSLTFFTLLLLFSVIESQFNNYFGQLSRTTETVPPDEDELFIDNRIDEIPTYVPPAERLLKSLTRGLGILLGQSIPNKNSSGMEKVISGITRPIASIFKPSGNTDGRATTTGFGQILNLVKDHFRAVYPGTLWCGAGDAAKSLEEFGFFKVTDGCCKDHDFCKTNILAGESSRGLRNDGVYTRSHCDCDQEFYYCLKNAHSAIATKIGITYFNILRPQCFKEEYPATCYKYGHLRIARSKCKEYYMDTSKNMTMQWFDNPDF